ncbi:unnamed protein product [Effrenium voratum]|nr:unnamed protein product [Effrenium voratum]
MAARRISRTRKLCFAVQGPKPQRTSGPAGQIAAAARAVARRAEDSRAFSREHLELHLRNRAAALVCGLLEPSEPSEPSEGPKPGPPAGPRPRSVSSRPTAKTRGSTPSARFVNDQKEASASRHVRIQELQRGLIDHDEARLASISRGTSPLTGARGQPMIPVPPVDVDALRLPLDLRLRLAVGNKISKGFRRPWLMAVHQVAEEARDEPLQEVVQEVMEDEQCFDAALPREGPVAPRPFYEVPRSYNTPKELLARSEELCKTEAAEDQCMPIAWRMLGEAHSAHPPEVLCMLRTVTRLAQEHGFTAASRKDLLQIADELLHSLTPRLKDASVEFLQEVAETMVDCSVGSQAFENLVQLEMGWRAVGEGRGPHTGC